jgi:glycerol-3-phosphate dehydrogenase subunit B
MGACDFVTWESAHSAAPIDASCMQILAALGCVSAPEGGARLASSTGILRTARANDDALLDLGKVGAGRVVVLDAVLGGWDAGSISRSYNAHALRGEHSFEALSCALIKHTDERAMTFAELAGRHDDPARLAWLADAIKTALGKTANATAILTPPILGAKRSRAAELSALVGIRCGEALAPFSSPAGRRFEGARDRALELAHVAAIEGWVAHVAVADKVTVELEEGDSLECDAVILATGGLLGGGIVYSPAEGILATAMPPYPRRVFQCSIDAPVRVGHDGKELVVPGSMFGLAAEQLAWPFTDDPMMERIGVLAEETRVSDRVYVAGDLTADRPRTWLEALTSGALAGASAGAFFAS